MQKVLKVLFRTDDKPELAVEEVEYITLRYMQECVDGYIELVRLINNIDMYINEDGKYTKTHMPTIQLGIPGKPLDMVMGNCIFVSHDDDGNTTGLTDSQIEFIKNSLGNMGIIKGYEFVDLKYLPREILI